MKLITPLPAFFDSGILAGMDVLNQLSSDQRALVTRLPYRVGLWISHSDETGGQDAVDKELVALSNILEGFSAQVFGSELLQYIMNETTAQRDVWTDWAADLEHVPEECRQSLDILREHVDEKEVKAYAQRLIEIGEAVALAFRESAPENPSDRFRLYVSYVRAALQARLAGRPLKSYQQFLSISMNERKALGVLADVLETPYSL